MHAEHRPPESAKPQSFESIAASPETYEVQLNPNILTIALESALHSATAPLYDETAQFKAEMSQLRADQNELVRVGRVLLEGATSWSLVSHREES
ncbi:MAG: hypothetical protein AAFY72_12285 [Cyanobacteria bacterium J06649_4]